MNDRLCCWACGWKEVAWQFGEDLRLGIQGIVRLGTLKEARAGNAGLKTFTV